MPLTIGGSVGARDAQGVAAANAADDVFVVQGLLNNISSEGGGASPRLAFDGQSGPRTIAAIRQFQQTQLGFQDGRVDPRGRTIDLLNEVAGVRCVRLHTKVLVNPTVSVDTMVTTMRRVFAQAAIEVDVVANQNLDLPGLHEVDRGACPRGADGPTTAEQTTLFGHRDGVEENEIVVYYVLALSPPLVGCSAHPPGRPGATIRQTGTRFTLAHEVANVLGLFHIGGEVCQVAPNFTRLMTGCGTAGIAGTPLFDPGEIATLRAAPLLFAC